MPPLGWKKPPGYAGYRRTKQRMPTRAQIALVNEFDEEEEQELRRLERGMDDDVQDLKQDEQPSNTRKRRRSSRPG